MTAGELCNRRVASCVPIETAIEAARRMRDRHVGCLVVLDDARRPVGIVTDRDLTVRVLAAGVDGHIVPVSTVMSMPVVTAPASEALEQTLSRMRRTGVRRFPVVDDAGVLQGLVTMDDLLDHLSQRVADLVAIEARELGKEKEPA